MYVSRCRMLSRIYSSNCDKYLVETGGQSEMRKGELRRGAELVSASFRLSVPDRAVLPTTLTRPPRPPCHHTGRQQDHQFCGGTAEARARRVVTVIIVYSHCLCTRWRRAFLLYSWPKIKSCWNTLQVCLSENDKKEQLISNTSSIKSTCLFFIGFKLGAYKSLLGRQLNVTINLVATHE